MFELCCSSISGGNFISQIASLTFMLEVRFKSKIIKKEHLDLYLGASGGSLANILVTFFYENKESVERILYILNSGMFVQNWWKGYGSTINSTITSIFEDSIYETGKGAKESLRKIIPRDHFKTSPENWFLTYNNDKNIPEIHCTMNNDKTIFNDIEDVNKKFLNYDLSEIVDTAMASASIPGLKNSIKLKEENHIDGGISSPTPFCFFSENLYEKSVKGDITSPYHYYYFLPHNLTVDNTNSKIWLNDIFSGIKKMIVYNIIKDLSYSFENWLRLINKKKSDIYSLKYKKINKLELLKILEDNHEFDYFIKFFTDRNTINIVDFTEKELKESFDNCYNSVFIEIFINKNGAN